MKEEETERTIMVLFDFVINISVFIIGYLFGKIFSQMTILMIVVFLLLLGLSLVWIEMFLKPLLRITIKTRGFE